MDILHGDASKPVAQKKGSMVGRSWAFIFRDFELMGLRFRDLVDLLLGGGFRAGVCTANVGSLYTYSSSHADL